MVSRLSSDPALPPAGLIDLLIDDAAVFPPGSAALPDAVPAHRRIRASALAPFVGPLLVPAGRWRELPPLLDDEAPLDVVLISRRGDDGVDLAAALRGLAREAGARVVGVEVAMPAGSTDPRRTLDTVESLVTTRQSVTVEFDGADPDRVLAHLASVRRGRELAVRGKFRTGGTRPQDSPAAPVLAAVIAAATGRRVPVKFTAGLHHAVTGTHGPGGSVQYGVLNVISAIDRAAGARRGAGDAPPRRVVDALLADDPDALAGQAMSLSTEQVRDVRAVFTSFGCCGVLEPLAELTSLGVVAPAGRMP